MKHGFRSGLLVAAMISILSGPVPGRRVAGLCGIVMPRVLFRRRGE